MSKSQDGIGPLIQVRMPQGHCLYAAVRLNSSVNSLILSYITSSSRAWEISEHSRTAFLSFHPSKLKNHFMN